MKTKISFILLTLTAAACSAFAEDLSYSPLIPQAGDTELVIQHKAQVSQAKLANGDSFANVITSGTAPIVIATGAGSLQSLIVNTGQANSSVVVKSGTNIVATVATATSGVMLRYNVRFTDGLSVIVTGTDAPDLTFTWRP